MKKYKIAIGTIYEQKIKFFEEALREIGVKAEVIPAKVKSGVSDQPITQEETSRGAVRRAKEALKKNPEADFAIGIEVGYHPDPSGKYEMFCCATITDKEKFTKTCFSSRFLLPEFHQNVIKKKLYLSEFVRKYSKGKNDPVTNYLRDFIIYRKFLIKEAARNILLIYLRKEDY